MTVLTKDYRFLRRGRRVVTIVDNKRRTLSGHRKDAFTYCRCKWVPHCYSDPLRRCGSDFRFRRWTLRTRLNSPRSAASSYRFSLE